MENVKVAFVMLNACHRNIVGLEGAHSRPRTRMVEHGDHPSTVHAEDLLGRVPKTHAPTQCTREGEKPFRCRRRRYMVFRDC